MLFARYITALRTFKTSTSFSFGVTPCNNKWINSEYVNLEVTVAFLPVSGVEPM